MFHMYVVQSYRKCDCVVRWCAIFSGRYSEVLLPSCDFMCVGKGECVNHARASTRIDNKCGGSASGLWCWIIFYLCVCEQS